MERPRRGEFRLRRPPPEREDDEEEEEGLDALFPEQPEEQEEREQEQPVLPQVPPPQVGGVPPPVVPGVPVVAPFALSPAHIAGVIDMTTRVGQKIYETAAAPLTNKITCQAETLNATLASIRAKAQANNLMECLLIPRDHRDPMNNLVNLTQDYGQLSLQQVKDYCETYVNNPVRGAQDSFALYMCLFNSLTVAAKNKVLLRTEDYHIDGTPCGPLLHKVIIQISYVDTNATTKMLIDKLHNLPEYMVSVKYDIEKFNDHVNLIVNMLAARGRTTTDLLEYLFNAYRVVTDEHFHRYIETKENEYEDGQTPEYQALMTSCLNKYKVRKEKELWNEPTADQNKIVALQSQVDKLKKSKKTNTNNTNSGDSPRKRRKPKPDWCFVAPKGKEKKEKTVDGKQWWWCPKHKAWCRHRPENCKGIVPKDKTGGNNNPTKDKNKPEEDKDDLTLEEALQDQCDISVLSH